MNKTYLYLTEFFLLLLLLESEPIEFVDTVPVQTASLYQSVVVRCEADGDPEPTIKWTVNGKVPEGKLCILFDSLILWSLRFP
jgi:hypothetical protein